MHRNADIPEQEIKFCLRQISDHPEYLSTKHVTNKYLSYGLDVCPDPFSLANLDLIRQSLMKQTPLSVIRIGDGETNFLSYDHYPETPVLNDYAFKKIVLMQQDRFNINPEWMIYLQSLMKSSLLQADIIGVIGLWRAGKPTVDSLQEALIEDPRGISGHWRAVDYLLELAALGYLKDKLIASAHLYFSILENLSELIKASKETYIVSSCNTIKHRLKNKYPTHKFSFILVGETKTHLSTPQFLYHFYQKLPPRMEGKLCLVGAGPWSEIYCTWIKQRGGVAVDIGSGFDLLDGNILRPVHKLLKLDRNNPYKI